MLEELEEKDSKDSHWVGVDLCSLYVPKAIDKHFADLVEHGEISFSEDSTYPFPDFGASSLKRKCLDILCSKQWESIRNKLRPLGRTPTALFVLKQREVLSRVVRAVASYYSAESLRRIGARVKVIEQQSEAKTSNSDTCKNDSLEELTGNDVLVEAGVKTALSVVFSLLRQAWVQVAWQKQLEERVKQSGATDMVLPSAISLPNEVLQSFLAILNSLPDLSLSNRRMLSRLSLTFLDQANEFLQTVIGPNSQADSRGKQLALEILFSLTLQEGSLSSLVGLVSLCLSCLRNYQETCAEGSVVDGPCLSLDCCHTTVRVIRSKAIVGDESTQKDLPAPSFQPSTVLADGNVSVEEFIVFLMKELSRQSKETTAALNNGHSVQSRGGFAYETSDVYGCGSNSSSQLAMGSTEKFTQAAAMPHMKDAQLVQAGFYCSFLLFADNSIKACGKGSYGRLGLGNSETQSSLRIVNTFPDQTCICKIACSRGGEGHCLAIDTNGAVYSWGDGSQGKLGHGDSITKKQPKLISGLVGKTVIQVACGNRHSAAVTSLHELYTWGCGDGGQLGHGNTQTIKTPQKVNDISAVCQVSCGSNYTLALSLDNTTVWSFGPGNAGCLGHGNPHNQLKPKVIQRLQGVMCQKVCAGNLFSIVLSVTGQVYSFGSGSGVGIGPNKPPQLVPQRMEALSDEVIVDISVGDGHCLALTQRGEVFAWGTNSMGQCGQGHANSSVTTPSKVKGLESIQVRQISAGTSHSIMWTAIPTDRKLNIVWHWPFSVDVEEKTFQQLVLLVDQYKNVTDARPTPPFTDHQLQHSFLLSSLSLLHTHLCQLAPLGASSSHLPCGRQLGPTRELLLHLLDSHLPSDINQVCSNMLEVGVKLLLPPVQERVQLLLNLLPEDPLTFNSITSGQRRQIDIFLGGFLGEGVKDELALLVSDPCNMDIDESTDKEISWQETSGPIGVLLMLCLRMINYIHSASQAQLCSSTTNLATDIQLHSPLIQSFAQFITLSYIHVVAFSTCDHLYRRYLKAFTSVLDDHCVPLLEAFVTNARQASNPQEYVCSMEGVVLSFLVYQYPLLLAPSIPSATLPDIMLQLESQLLKVSRAVHCLLMFGPPQLLDQLERDELLHDPRAGVGVEAVTSELKDESVWFKLCLLQRVLCSAAGRCLFNMYKEETNFLENFESFVLSYTPPNKDMPSLKQSHLLSNGISGGLESLQNDITTWISLCRVLPHHQQSDVEWYIEVPNVQQDFIEIEDGFYSPPIKFKLSGKFIDIKPLSPSSTCTSTLFALAVGSTENQEAVSLYNDMMAVAKQRDWNTCTDEDSIPQLRQVSCAALACLLHHTGLLHATRHSGKPRREIINVYRAVFAIRKEVFFNRPVPNLEGVVDEMANRIFEQTCETICCHLFFFLCVVSQAVPHENQPIVPQIVGTNTAERQSSTENITQSPRTSLRASRSSITRLFSQPASFTSPPPVDVDEQPENNVFVRTPTDDSKWSLEEVKRSLSILQWQRERMNNLQVKGMSARSTLRSRVVDAIVGVVCALLLCVEKELLDDDDVLERYQVLVTLASQAYRAKSLKTLLQRVDQFLTSSGPPSRGYSDLLPSARFGFLTCCADNLSHDICCASAALQHEVKHLYDKILNQILSSVTVSPTIPIPAYYRNHLLSLLWLTTSHDSVSTNLILSGKLFAQLAMSSGCINSKVLPLVFEGTGVLADVLKETSTLAMQAIALQTCLELDPSSSTDQTLLTTPIEYLYGFLDGLVTHSTSSCSREEREGKLADFLIFLSSLLAVSSGILASVSSSKWSSLLLKCVGTDSKGLPNIASLKTRLLSLEMLGTVITCGDDNLGVLNDEHCSQLMETLLTLLHQFVFSCPIAALQHSVDQHMKVDHPFQFDANHCENCSASPHGWHGNYCVKPLAEGRVAGGSYALGATVLECGTYTWKVTPSVHEHAQFWIGVAVKPLADRDVTNSDEVWVLEGQSGRLYHNGVMEEMMYPVSNEDTVTIVYNVADRTLSFGLNDADPKLAFTEVFSFTKPLCPVIIFNQPLDSNNFCSFVFESLTCIQPVTACTSALKSEQAMSGYPFLSSSSTALTRAVCNLIYKLQEIDKWKKVISNIFSHRMKEMGTLINNFLFTFSEADLIDLEQRSHVSDLLVTLIKELCKSLWPCLAVIGGVQSGFCVGGECLIEQNGESILCVVIKSPTSSGHVEVQEVVTVNTAAVKQRSVHMSELKLPKLKTFSVGLLESQLSPSLLMNLAHLASLHDHPHNLTNLLTTLQDTFPSSSTSDIMLLDSCYPFLHLCEQTLRLAAVRSLHVILQDCCSSELLLHTSPTLEELASGKARDDRSELATALVDILRCLVTRATQPSLLRPALETLELKHISDMVSFEHLLKIFGAIDKQSVTNSEVDFTGRSEWTFVFEKLKAKTDSHKQQEQQQQQQVEGEPEEEDEEDDDNTSFNSSDMYIDAPPSLHLHASPPDTPLPSPPSSSHPSTAAAGNGAMGVASNVLLMEILLSMGFSRLLVKIAMRRCNFPDDVQSVQQRADVLVNWILEHPEAENEEEREVEHQRSPETNEVQQSNQAQTADEILSIFEKEYFEDEHATVKTAPVSKITAEHAPDLLGGPDTTDEVPDIALGGSLNKLISVNSLLSALGLTQQKQSLPLYQFISKDPLGAKTVLREVEEKGKEEEEEKESDTRSGLVGLSNECQSLVEQATRLKTHEECHCASDRLISATQTLMARQVILHVVQSLTLHSREQLFQGLLSIGLADIKKLVRLLRLLQGGRVSGLQNGLTKDKTGSVDSSKLFVDSLMSSITATLSFQEETGAQLVQSCCRDLLAATVGGVDFLLKMKGHTHHQESEQPSSDVTVLCNPQFSITQSLVQTVINTVTTPEGAAIRGRKAGLLVDALAACVLSSKLEACHRLWALKQLLKIFATCTQRKPPCPSESSPQPLIGHEAQVMQCSASDKPPAVLTLSEDDCVKVWRVTEESEVGEIGGVAKEAAVLKFPPTSIEEREKEKDFLILPILTVNMAQGCVAAGKGHRVCVWRLRDHSSVVCHLPDLVTSLQWRRGQEEGEALMLLVGTMGGRMVMVRVDRVAVNLPMELKVTELDQWRIDGGGAVKTIAWSHSGDKVVLATSGSQLQLLLFTGRGINSSSHIEEMVDKLSWSPNDQMLASVHGGVMKLWCVNKPDLKLVFQFADCYSVSIMLWHSQVGAAGSCLLAGGCGDGTAHLWTVTNTLSSPSSSDSSATACEVEVVHIAALARQQSLSTRTRVGVTRLCFSATNALLAVGYVDGSVLVWDIQAKELLRTSCSSATGGSVVDMCWSKAGLIWCNMNSTSPLLLTPSSEEYLNERLVHHCLPVLEGLGLAEPGATPCLNALLRNMPCILLNQYKHEENVLSSGQQLVHSEYLQLLAALAVGLQFDQHLTFPALPPHLPPPSPHTDWEWLHSFASAVKMANSFGQRSSISQAMNNGVVTNGIVTNGMELNEKHQPLNNTVWTSKMDSQILQWMYQRPKDWWPAGGSTVFTWGKGSWNQLGTSTSEICHPAIAEWTDAQMVVAGNRCTYVIKYDGSVSSVGDGSCGRLGHGGSDNEPSLRTIGALSGLRVWQLVAGPRISHTGSNAFALALTSTGDVYSWGKGYRGRLGHNHTGDCRIPKLVEALAGKDIRMIACCDYHSAAVSSSGDLYTFGCQEHGKTGRETGDVHVGLVTKYLSDDEEELDNVKIRYVACGEKFTVAINKEGNKVFMCGKMGRRRTQFLKLLSLIDPFGPFTKASAVQDYLALINNRGQLCAFGKLYDGGTELEPHYLPFPNDERVVDVQGADQYMIAVTECGNVYSWGKNSASIIQLGCTTRCALAAPKHIDLQGAHIKQISTSVNHVCCSTLSPPTQPSFALCVPDAVPPEYSHISSVPCPAIHGRMQLLDQFSQLVLKCWKLFNHHPLMERGAVFHMNPLVQPRVRSTLLHTLVEGLLRGVLARTMATRSVGPDITVRRLEQPDKPVQPIFTQISHQIMKKDPASLRCSTRAWKVTLVGEGADDAGGVFDETMAEMCRELESPSTTFGLLMQTPNSRNSCGFNTDRFVLNPECCSEKELTQFKFMGIMFGVAIRTRRPLDLHLASPMWKLLAGMRLTSEDLEEVDLMFTQTLYSIRDVHKEDISEDDFSEMIPIESYEALNMNGKFVPIVHGGNNIPLTFQNRKDYVEKALHFRLHELDKQVAAVREGMACIVPVPIFSLLSSAMLEKLVCGSEEIDIHMLKKVAKYKGGLTENHQLAQWLWQTLYSFTNEERVLFLRFVSGRSRLPAHASEIGQRFTISKGSGSNSLPTAQTCFFQLRLPEYSSQEQLAEKLLYSITNCRSIDMDNYMLRRLGSSQFASDSSDYSDYSD